MSCLFSQECLDETINPQFSSWLKPLKDPNTVLSCFCQRWFALSIRGKRALESHMNSDKHKRNVSAKAPSMRLYFKKSTAPSKTFVSSSADGDTDTKAFCATATEIIRIPAASLKKTTLWPLFMDGVQLPEG